MHTRNISTAKRRNLQDKKDTDIGKAGDAQYTKDATQNDSWNKDLSKDDSKTQDVTNSDSQSKDVLNNESKSDPSSSE